MATATPTIKHLVLWLTTDCNLSCVYCYRGSPAKSQVMTKQTAITALNLAARSGKPFHLQLAGGEPTLEPQLIELVARKVRSDNLPATIAVQTNATLLTRATAELFQRWDIGVGVSLDGPLKQQEALRGLSAETLRGMEHLEQVGVGFGVTAVVCAENVKRLPRLALMLSRFKHAHGLGLDLLVCRGRAAQDGPAMVEPQVLSQTMIELVGVMAWINQQRKTPLILRELDRLKNKRSSFCHAAVGASLAVHPNGNLFPCGQTMGDQDLAMGSIYNPDFSKIGDLQSHRLAANQCSGCLLAGHCPGECPSRLKYNGQKGQKLACAMLQGLAMGLRRDAHKLPMTVEHGNATA